MYRKQIFITALASMALLSMTASIHSFAKEKTMMPDLPQSTTAPATVSLFSSPEQPSDLPPVPTHDASSESASESSPEPALTPSPEPTGESSSEPGLSPSPEPTLESSPEPTLTPSPEPTSIAPKVTATPKPRNIDRPITKRAIANGHWKKKKGKKYYLLENGVYLKGVVKIKNKIYAFSTKGDMTDPSPLLTGKTDRVLKIKKKWYHVNQKGVVLPGWHLKGKRLYYFNGKLHCAITGRTIQHIRFNQSGYAVKNVHSDVKIASMKIVNRITRKGDSKAIKLQKAFSYMTNRYNWRYLPKYPNLGYRYWPRKLGTNMLTTRAGNCYGFACGFAALANEIGYKPKIICGRVHGSRDRAPDGFTRHGLVKINGRYYDPEGWWKGFVHANGSRYYPISLKIIKVVPF